MKSGVLNTGNTAPTLTHPATILSTARNDIVIKTYPGMAQAVAAGDCEKGILICGTGIGISITANKVPGVRAALCSDCFSAQATREHNNANVLALGARVLGEGLALKIVDTFLDTEFSNDERHVRRISMIEG